MNIRKFFGLSSRAESDSVVEQARNFLADPVAYSNAASKYIQAADTALRTNETRYSKTLFSL
jgi:hypothetical protein